jgi:magnesium transporter
MIAEEQKGFIEELKTALANGNLLAMSEELKSLHEADIAEIIDDLPLQNALQLIRLFEEEKAAEILVELDEELRDKIIEQLSPKEIAEIVIDNLDSDDAADIMGELSEEKINEVISQMEDEEHAKSIVQLLNYDEDSAGGLMASELIKVNEDLTVLTCVREMRRQAEKVEEVHTIYVVDEEDKLLGTLSLKKLLTFPTKTKISELYNPKVISVQAEEKAEAVAQIFRKYDLVVLPVVSAEGRLLGRITVDDVVDVMQEEAERDYQLASGLSEDVESDDSIFLLTRARLPWLLVGMFGGIMGAQVIGIFDLEKHYQLAYFIPLIAATGGNVGVQSAAIIVQGLANQSLKGGMLRRLYKEFLLGLLNGIFCAAIIFGVCKVMSLSLMFAATVSLALFSVIIFAALVGTFVPLTLNKYNIDPALATGPFITTLNDVVGLFIYFTIGNLLM